MIFSIAIILLSGFILGIISSKLKLPKLIGMMIAGFIIGPYCLGLISSEILDISAQLRQIALVIILTKAGLGLDIKTLKKVGRPAVLMCFLPACFEIIGVTLLGIFLFNITIFESILLGSVLAAVSPAVVVPFMLKIKEEGYGEKVGIGEIILAGSSCDDIFVITLFYAFLSLNQTSEFNFSTILQIPTSIILAIGVGVIVGLVLSILFKKIKFNVAYMILLTLSSSFLLIALESYIDIYVSISSLLAIMVFNIILNVKSDKEVVSSLKDGYNNLWYFFEIILFVLVGASLNFELALDYGFNAVLLIVLALLFRSIGVVICLIKTNLNFKEKAFCMISYLPKATVQASIGGIALQVGLNCGGLILTVSIIAILITAPLGSILMKVYYKKLLERDESYETY